WIASKQNNLYTKLTLSQNVLHTDALTLDGSRGYQKQKWVTGKRTSAIHTIGLSVNQVVYPRVSVTVDTRVPYPIRYYVGNLTIQPGDTVYLTGYDVAGQSIERTQVYTTPTRRLQVDAYTIGEATLTGQLFSEPGDTPIDHLRTRCNGVWGPKVTPDQETFQCPSPDKETLIGQSDVLYVYAFAAQGAFLDRELVEIQLHVLAHVDTYSLASPQTKKYVTGLYRGVKGVDIQRVGLCLHGNTYLPSVDVLDLTEEGV
ncbi:hypothetical protein HCJ39_15690, partial [Listeria rocourtiae]|nr:hypothetical protein [Listeria rocourtiae]